jgi:lysophospholipid acyltransferase (LPLAT)-like uncharacterized protein
MTRLDRLKIALAAVLVRVFLTLLGSTWRWRVVGSGEALDELLEGSPTARTEELRPVLFCYWHNGSLPMARFVASRLLARGWPLAILSSLSRDGELGARLSRAWGATVFRGSASRGGTSGLRKLFRHLRQGGSCILAPDGPRGPVYQVKPGIVVLSQMTGAPVIPLGAAADRFWRLRSWDRMIVPKPFARVWLVIGEPEAVAAETEMEEGQRQVAAGLDAVAKEAETLAETLAER